MKARFASLMALAAAFHLAAADDESLVAHEWGTFTSVAGADGVQISWNPLLRTDLPTFVYHRDPGVDGGALAWRKDTMATYVRMETPVIYFYSKQATTVDVTVRFPEGRVTEWYPQATRVGPFQAKDAAEKQYASRSFIEWRGVNVLARDVGEMSTEKLIREAGANHYYAARETDANFLRVNAAQARAGTESDRMLFYRGVGMFKAPIVTQLLGNEEQLQISTKNAEPLTDLFVLTVREGMARYQSLSRVAPDAPQAVKLTAGKLEPLSGVREKLMRSMASRLEEHGLFAREAKAMVETWKDQWFEEEGVRVLYILPRAWTDRVLPLEIAPRPTKIERVMVGRAEIITPAMEWELLKQIVRYSENDPSLKAQAVASIRKLGLGRFSEPVTRRVLGNSPSQPFSESAWSLAREASQPVSRLPAVAEVPELPAQPKKTAWGWEWTTARLAN